MSSACRADGANRRPIPRPLRVVRGPNSRPQQLTLRRPHSMCSMIDYPAFDWDLVKRVGPLSFVFIAYVVVSLVSLGRVNVPMFTALRRLTILFVMVEEYYYFGTVPSRAVTNTVIIMTIGAAIAAWKDLTFDPVSYFFLFLTNVFTSLYTVFINVIKKETKLDIFAMMYYNNITTMPALLVLAWATGDLQAAWNFTHWGDWFFQFNFQASVVLAFFLNLSTFYCTTLNEARTQVSMPVVAACNSCASQYVVALANRPGPCRSSSPSPLPQTVVGQLKNFVAFLLGLVLFDDYIYDHINFLGLMVGFAGSVWYTYVTYVERMEKDAKDKAQAALKAGGEGAAAPSTPMVPQTATEAQEDSEAGRDDSRDALLSDAGARRR